MIKLVAFDGDDTLWHNERLYKQVRQVFHSLIEKYDISLTDDAQVDAVELRNLPYYGYGVMSFILSLIESAIELTGGRISAQDIHALIDQGKLMLSAEVDVFENAARTLAVLSGLYPLMLVTKGEPNHQLAKVRRSGLEDYFEQVEVVTDKNSETFAGILTRQNLLAEQFIMVGNSLRSDILPVLALGGYAVYIPHSLTWNHELAEHPGGDNDHLFELSDLSELPALLQQINIE